MTVLLNDTCDNFTNWTTGGSPTIVSALHGNGFNFPIGSSNRAKYLLATGDRSTSMTVGLNVRFGALIQHDFVMLYADAGTNNQNTLRLNANGSLSCFTPPITVHGSSAPGSIAINTWYYVEATYLMSDTVGIATLKIDGTTIFSATSQDTKALTTVALYDQVWLQSIGGAGSAAWQVDDVYIRNDNTFGGVVAPTAKIWNGSAFVSAPAQVWTGSAFVAASAIKTWNGSAFV